MTENPADPPREAEIERYLDPRLSDDALYAALADSAGLGADELDRSGAGKTMFSRVWRQAADKVCANKMVAAYIRDPTASDATAIAAQIINLLVAVKGINVVIVACLAMRIGLRKLCVERETITAPE